MRMPSSHQAQIRQAETEQRDSAGLAHGDGREEVCAGLERSAVSAPHQDLADIVDVNATLEKYIWLQRQWDR